MNNISPKAAFRTSFCFRIILSISLAAIVSLSSHAQEGGKLTLHEYLDKGIGHPDSIWDARTYEKTANVLSDLKESAFDALPDLSHPQTRAIFTRMISVENFKSMITIKNIRENPQQFMTLPVSVGRMLMIYMNGTESKQVYHVEVRELMIAVTRIVEIMIDEMSTVMPTGKLTETQKASLQKMESGYTKVMDGLLDAQGHVDTFSEEDQEKLSEAICLSLEKYWDWVLKEKQKDFKKKVSEFATNGTTKEIQYNYKLLKKKL